MESERLLSPGQVAKILGISIQTLAIWRCSKRYPLPYIKVGTRVRYRQADVASFVRQRTHGFACRSLTPT